ncbi:unnamed protein product [Phytophthora lilii]|uniref:Unnamed protein product n=1 Tax=Phytophthora lilii TaxID=2077276 RepID=A0A9W6U4M4_9STRA|nr:unnamed protein product [Phytophthora lilii]
MSVVPNNDHNYSLAAATLNGRHARHLESPAQPRFNVGQQIAPEPSSNKSVFRLGRESSSTNASFRQAYGALGLPLLVVAVVCILWTSWLIFLTLAPNEAANRLMHTEDYDNGQFWLIVEREPFVKWSSAIGFAVVYVGYMAVLVKMFMFQSVARRAKSNATSKSWYVVVAERCRLQQAVKVWVDLTGYDSKHRKYFVSIYSAYDVRNMPRILILHARAARTYY